MSTVVAPVQAHVNAHESEDSSTVLAKAVKSEDDATQRGNGCITLSTVPRAYWTTLFYLESIKARNRPTEAPKKAPSAPFFLPTVVRSGGSAPSFPTPAEYSALLSQTPEIVPVMATIDEDSKGQQSSTPNKNKKQRAEDTSGTTNDNEILNQLSSMGSVWNDNGDGEGDWGEMDVEEPDGEGEQEPEVNGKSFVSNSRVISKKTTLPRCVDATCCILTS